MQILAISGSLRAQSGNTALLLAAKQLAPSPVIFTLFEELAAIPAFNPDLDTEPAPSPVSSLRKAVHGAQAVFFSTPEYAHGVPGALKNALDWLVGSGEFSGKPVALLNTSTRSVYALNSLREILTTMDARLLADAETTIPVSQGAEPAQILTNPEFRRAVLSAIEQAIASVRAQARQPSTEETA